MHDDAELIRQRYAERDAAGGASSFWTFHNPVVLHVAQEREQVFWRAVRQLNLNLADIDILDVGAGTGREMLNLSRWGASARRVIGIDLCFARTKYAHQAHRLNVVNADAVALPFRSEQFDAVIQNVVFSSIISQRMRIAAAAEITRVMTPGGLLLWYDAFRVRRPDQYFRPVPKTEVEELFNEFIFTWYDLTSDIGLLRIANIMAGEIGMCLIDFLGFFRTNLFAVGRKLGRTKNG